MTVHGDQNDDASSRPEGTPASEVIAEAIRQRIESGEMRAGESLPTDLQLRDEYQASRKTIQDAIGLLVYNGFVEVSPEQGPLVSQMVSPLVMDLDMATTSLEDEFVRNFSSGAADHRRHTVSGPRIEIQSATGIVASQLQLEEGASIVIRHCSHFIEGTPWSLRTCFFPWWIVEQGATDLLQAAPIPSGIGAYLWDVVRIQRASGQAVMTARLADQNEVSFFRLSGDRDDVPIFEISATEVDDKGRPFRIITAAYPADRNRFMFGLPATRYY